MASCMASLTIHYFELNWKSCICSCSCGRSEDPAGGIQTRTWRRICCLYKWFSGFQPLLWHYFFFFPLDFCFTTLPVSRETKKSMFCTLCSSKLPGPLPLLGEAATSLLSLSKACMLHIPQDHLPLAHGDSQGNWFSLSQLTPEGFPWFGWFPWRKGNKVSPVVLL